MADINDLTAFVRGRLQPTKLQALSRQDALDALNGATNREMLALASATARGDREGIARAVLAIVERHIFAGLDAEATAIAADGSLSIAELVQIGILE